MRVIPVIDVLNDLVVHAIRGERKSYKPVQSLLCSKPNPSAIARSFRDSLGLNELYIADLNSIQFNDRTRHRQLIASLAASEKIDIILDAGISESEDALAWLKLNIRKVVIGAETLNSFTAIRQLPEKIDCGRLIFSLDLRYGKILSRCPELAAMRPIQAMSHLQSAGWKEVILLDLSKVGTKAGIDTKLIREARNTFPEINLLVGGGLANIDQLSELRSIGVAGVLVATALHRGIITAQHLAPNAGNANFDNPPA